MSESISLNRIKRDIKQLKQINCNLKIINKVCLTLDLNGPKDSLYEHGSWKIKITIPKEYPFKSPSVGFLNTIYHPNIDEKSGSVCLDILNQEWGPTFSLLNIYETFLPQLLMYPNPNDPLNIKAAKHMKEDPDKFKTLIGVYIKKYSIKNNILK